MRIVRVDVYGYDLSYVHGRYVMSGGRVIETLPSTVVRVTTARRRRRLRRGLPARAGVPAVARRRAPGRRSASSRPRCSVSSAGNLGAINAAMDAALMGHGYAKSAIDTACWDALGRSVGLPVCDLLGGRLAGDVPALLRGAALPRRRR